MTPLPLDPDVIVIGAGVAGLSAAQALGRAGVSCVVLEAAGHTGGRCVTDTTTFPVPFDRGCSWLHSAPINPLARIAEGRGCALHKTEWTRRWVHAQGEDLAPDEVAAFQSYQDAMWPAIALRGAQDPDTTTAAAMPPADWSEAARCAIAQMIGGDADVTSARDTFNYAEAKGDWLVDGGLGGFAQRLFADVSVQLNCPVTKIDYSGKNVVVTTLQGTMSAPRVIVTVSTGVLAAERIAFNPPLPARKRDAIEQLPNGLLNKIGILFDPDWRGAEEAEMLDYHAGGEAFCSILFGFYGTGFAVGFVAGRFADALEAEGAATAFCREALRHTFGSDIDRYIRQTDETAWRGDPLTLGSYSYAKPGGTAGRAVLAEPLADRVYFAGEATMTDTYSTVHGAYLSGQRAADEIIAARA